MVDGPGTDRAAIEAIVGRRSAGTLELVDRSVLEAIERLVELGVLRFASEDRRLLHRSPALGPRRDVRRDQRLARARDLLAQSERKIRMAAVLSGGGFAVEALPSLREGVELGLRARALTEEMDLPESGEVSADWIETRLPAHLPLIRTLRDGSEVLLGATATEVGSWIQAGETLAREAGDALRRAGAG